MLLLILPMHHFLQTSSLMHFHRRKGGGGLALYLSDFSFSLFSFSKSKHRNFVLALEENPPELNMNNPEPQKVGKNV